MQNSVQSVRMDGNTGYTNCPNCVVFDPISPQINMRDPAPRHSGRSLKVSVS